MTEQQQPRVVGAQALIDRWIFKRKPNDRLDLAYRVLYLRSVRRREISA